MPLIPREKEYMREGRWVEKRDGPVVVFYYSKPSVEAKKKVPAGKSIPSEIQRVMESTDTHYVGRYAQITAEPPLIGKELADYVNGLPAGGCDGDGSGLRIHESAHHFNSGKSERMLGGNHRSQPVADFLREAHSELVSQALNLSYPDSHFKNFALEGYKEKIKRLSRIYGADKAKAIVDEFITHTESLKNPERVVMAEYAVKTIWRLRAIGLNEREVGETIAMFQREKMLAWESQGSVCPMVESWVCDRMGEKGIDEAGMITKIAEIRRQFEENNRRVREIVNRRAVEFVSRVGAGAEKPLIIRSQGKIVADVLPEGLKAGEGHVFVIRFDPSLRVLAERVDLARGRAQRVHLGDFALGEYTEELFYDMDNLALALDVERHTDAMSGKETGPIGYEQWFILGRIKEMIESRRDRLDPSDSYTMQKFDEELIRIDDIRGRFGAGGE